MSEQERKNLEVSSASIAGDELTSRFPGMVLTQLQVERLARERVPTMLVLKVWREVDPSDVRYVKERDKVMIPTLTWGGWVDMPEGTAVMGAGELREWA